MAKLSFRTHSLDGIMKTEVARVRRVCLCVLSSPWYSCLNYSMWLELGTRSKSGTFSTANKKNPSMRRTIYQQRAMLEHHKYFFFFWFPFLYTLNTYHTKCRRCFRCGITAKISHTKKEMMREADGEMDRGREMYIWKIAAVVAD